VKANRLTIDVSSVSHYSGVLLELVEGTGHDLGL